MRSLLRGVFSSSKGTHSVLQYDAVCVAVCWCALIVALCVLFFQRYSLCVAVFVAVCCSVLQSLAVRRCALIAVLRILFFRRYCLCVAVCCRVLHVLQCTHCGVAPSLLPNVLSLCCNVLQCIEALQSVAVNSSRVVRSLLQKGVSLLQCVAECCRVLQSVAVCCSVLRCCNVLQ